MRDDDILAVVKIKVYRLKDGYYMHIMYEDRKQRRQLIKVSTNIFKDYTSDIERLKEIIGLMTQYCEVLPIEKLPKAFFDAYKELTQIYKERTSAYFLEKHQITNPFL